MPSSMYIVLFSSSMGLNVLFNFDIFNGFLHFEVSILHTDISVEAAVLNITISLLVEEFLNYQIN